MKLLTKLKLFSFVEIFYAILTSIATKMGFSNILKKIPDELINLQGVLVSLYKQGVVVKKHRDMIFFNYKLNDQIFKIFIKRNSSDAHVFRQIVLLNEYREVIAIIKKYNIPVGLMIDAGANIGLTSLYFKSYFPYTKIVAVEPSANTFERLKKNISENGMSNVHLLSKGLWSHKTALFEDRTFRDGQDWSFRLVANKMESESKIETVSVPDIIDEFKIDFIDVLKIDIEGAEKEVINANSNLEWLEKVRMICIEIHDEFKCREVIEKLLIQHGFFLHHSGELTIGVNKKHSSVN